jgi:HAMP domain-containing protein
MLVKFEEDENKSVSSEIPGEINIEELSTTIGKQEAEIDKEKYTPTQEEIDALENELKKLTDQKFGEIEGPTGNNGPDDSSLNEVEEIKRLNYTRRDA